MKLVECLLCSGLMLVAVRLPAAETNASAMARLIPVPPCPALVAAAQSHHIWLDRMDPPAETNLINPGDSFTALVTLNEKRGRRTQWLVYLEAVTPGPGAPADDSSGDMVIYNTFGNKLEFPSAPVPVSLRTLGPFVVGETGKSAKASDKSTHFTLDQGYLGLGLDAAAAAFLRMEQFKLSGPVGAATVPYSAATVSEGKKLAAALNITPAEERALGGTYPALLSYFWTVDQTPGLEAILTRVADMPSIWSILRHGGIGSVEFQWRVRSLRTITLDGWELPGHSPVYFAPMQLLLNGHPTLNLTLVVTRPHPPLLACGGIVGVLAEKTGDPETFLTLRIISACHYAATGFAAH